MYKKGDWGYWSKRSEELIKEGYGKEQFIRYTLRHKVRLFIGIRGSINETYYFYNFMNGKYNKIINLLVNLIPSI